MSRNIRRYMCVGPAPPRASPPGSVAPASASTSHPGLGVRCQHGPALLAHHLALFVFMHSPAHQVLMMHLTRVTRVRSPAKHASDRRCEERQCPRQPEGRRTIRQPGTTSPGPVSQCQVQPYQPSPAPAPAPAPPSSQCQVRQRQPEPAPPAGFAAPASTSQGQG